MKVVIENGKMKVESPYNKEFVARAKQLGGKWSAPYWVFSEDNEDFVRTALMAIYGEDGTPSETVKIDVRLEDKYYGQEIIVAGRCIARRRGRDSAVSMENGAILVSGGFEGRGGSVRRPSIDKPKGETIIRVSVPKKALENIDVDYTICETRKIDKEALEREKAELLKRLKEIDAILEEAD